MLTKQQMLAALDGLISQAERIRHQFLNDFIPWSPEFTAWLKACESTIETIFGSTSHVLSSFKGIYFIPPWQQFANDVDRQKAQVTWFESGLRFARDALVGYRYSVERLAVEEPKRSTPYIFISHGGPTMTHVHAVRDFLVALGLGPVIVSELPNMNLSVNEKVRFYMGLCTGAIALATVEDETSAQEQRARPNVENEIGMLQVLSNIGSRIVYLKEPEVVFASNYQEKVWISFSKERVQDAFTALTKELRAFGFIK